MTAHGEIGSIPDCANIANTASLQPCRLDHRVAFVGKSEGPASLTAILLRQILPVLQIGAGHGLFPMWLRGCPLRFSLTAMPLREVGRVTSTG